MKKTILALIMTTCFASFADPAVEGFYFDQGVQASYNPLGLQLISKVFYRLPLVNAEGALWESTKLDVGVLNNLSPGYDFAGVFLNIQPIAVFDLGLSAQVAGYYNWLGYGFYDLEGYGSSFHTTGFNGSSKNAFGYVLSASPTLKFAIEPIAALNTFSIYYFYAGDGKGYFFERVGNVPIAKSDIELWNQAYLLMTVYDGLRVGANDYIVYVPNSKYLSHRLSGIATYSTKLTEDLEIYGALLLGTFLQDRYYQYTFFIGGQAGITLRL